ncbi:hypothetical protein L1887_05929 [Cichorium endivia]|nr:hypothetical protein L1887_05929 [Cichorium endivia]
MGLQELTLQVIFKRKDDYHHKKPLDFLLILPGKWVAQYKKGMNYLHECKPYPLIHCDLRPKNILLDSAGQLKVSGCGLIRLSKISPNKEDYYGLLPLIEQIYTLHQRFIKMNYSIEVQMRILLVLFFTR